MRFDIGMRLIEILPTNHKVLDIGGWWQPFPRADYVVDAQPYSTRNQGNTPFNTIERFTKDTWIIADVNSRLPFKDKEFDFVICSHVLEDIRDPINLLKEISRVGKEGYIETPSRMYESIKGLESTGYVGLYHHRWLIELENDRLVFRHKPHSIHGSRDLSIPKKMKNSLTDTNRVVSLQWKDNVQGIEVIDLSMKSVNEELRAFAAPFRSKAQNLILKFIIWSNFKEQIKKITIVRTLASMVKRKKIQLIEIKSDKFYSS
jgi:SAM-dependent methyltransferase